MGRMGEVCNGNTRTQSFFIWRNQHNHAYPGLTPVNDIIISIINKCNIKRDMYICHEYKYTSVLVVSLQRVFSRELPITHKPGFIAT